MPPQFRNYCFRCSALRTVTVLSCSASKPLSQVLCFKSKRFSALLQPGWSETQDGRGTVRVAPEHSARIFRSVLSWIYVGATEPVDADDLPPLLRAASFYLLPDLYAEVLRMATASLCVHNALPWLLFAAEHQEEGLRAAALQFAVANYRHIRRLRLQESAEHLRCLHVSFPELSTELTDAATKASAVAATLAAEAAARKRKRDADGAGPNAE